jgi:hypothetical protein
MGCILNGGCGLGLPEAATLASGHCILGRIPLVSRDKKISLKKQVFCVS